MARAPAAVDIRDIAIIRGAHHFTTALFLGRGIYAGDDQLPSLEAAKAAAAALEAKHTPRRAMIYGVNAAGRSAMVTPDLETLMQAQDEIFSKDYSAKSAAIRALKHTGLEPDQAEVRFRESDKRWIVAKPGAPKADDGPLNPKGAAKAAAAGRILGDIIAKAVPSAAPALKPKSQLPRVSPPAPAAAKAKAQPRVKAAPVGEYTDWREKPAYAEEWKRAQSGKLPAAPDFSAPTHAGYRGKLAKLEALVKARDLKAVKAFEINPASPTRRALERYRQCAVAALEAKGKAAA